MGGAKANRVDGSQITSGWHKNSQARAGARANRRVGAKAKARTVGALPAASKKRLWIGGLPENSTSKDTNKALKELLGAVFAEIGKSGTGVATFKTEEEASAAVASFNGAEFQGSTLQIDAWEKAEK